MFKKFGLIIKILIGIVAGMIIGVVSTKLDIVFPVRLLATFNDLFGNLLNFVIPLIIIGFVTSGIADLGMNAGKILGATTATAYISTIISGLLAFLVASNVFPLFIINNITDASNPEEALLSGYINIEFPAIMGVMSALVLAFILGLGIAVTKAKRSKEIAIEFKNIIEFVIAKAIIPLLPFHICGIFANMTHAGRVMEILKVLLPVFAIIIVMHLFTICAQFAIACGVSGKNFLSCLKNQVSPYLTAVGTQSSAATIPVNLVAAEKNGVSKSIAEFVVPLCATIHLSGSTITLTSCAIAVMLMNGLPFTFPMFFKFILVLGVTMVAAPGVPGGAVMAAIGLFTPMLGFSPAQSSLMIALYIAQDSFGTACNVSGDNAIAIFIDKFFGDNSKNAKKQNTKNLEKSADVEVVNA